MFRTDLRNPRPLGRGGCQDIAVYGNEEYDEQDDIGTDDEIYNLLVEIKDQREALKSMIKDLEFLKEKINNLFPENMDKRYVRFFEEKVKAATGIFNSILDMRKEITKSLKDEIEIRRKLEGSDNSEDLFNDMDIRSLASKIESINIANKKIKEKLKQTENKENDENLVE